MNLRLGEPEAALMPLRKLHGLLPDQPEVIILAAAAALVAVLGAKHTLRQQPLHF